MSLESNGAPISMDIELLADNLRATEEALQRLAQRLDGLEEHWTQQHLELNGSIPSQETILALAQEAALAQYQAQTALAEAAMAEAEAAEVIAEAEVALVEAEADLALSEAAGEPPEEVPGPEQVEIIEAGPEEPESDPVVPNSRNSELDSLTRGRMNAH